MYTGKNICVHGTTPKCENVTRKKTKCIYRKTMYLQNIVYGLGHFYTHKVAHNVYQQWSFDALVTFHVTVHDIR